jgi:DNA-binding LacI/PurR family transcriptional regulator
MQQGIGLDQAVILMNINNDIRAMQAVEQALKEKVDGIICMDDTICTMTLSCLREKGVKVPGEIRLASLYDSSQLRNSIPSVTSLQFDTKELGRSACRALMKILGENVEQEQPKLDYQVVLRESTK